MATIQLNKEQTMSGASLYRALVPAGAPEAEAREPATEIDNMKTILTELRITNRIIIALLIAVLIKSFF